MKLYLKFLALSALLLTLTFHTELNQIYIRSIAKSAVVKIYVPEVGSGSGFFIATKNGLRVLTNKHICKMAKTGFEFHDENIKNIRYAEIEKISENHDLCLMKPLSVFKDQTKLDISFNEIKLGFTVYIAGYPGGRPLSVAKGEFIGNRDIELAEDLKKGEICNGKIEENNPLVFIFTGVRHICIQKLNADQHNLIAYGGNSGSPILNNKGQVIGVLFAGSDQPTDSLAVPLSYIKQFLKEYNE